MALLFFCITMCGYNCKFDAHECSNANLTLNSFINDKITFLSTSVQGSQGELNSHTIRIIFFFERLTGYTSNAHIGEGYWYERSSDHKKDIKHWKEWFEASKCTLSYKEVDYIWNEVLRETPYLVNDREFSSKIEADTIRLK